MSDRIRVVVAGSALDTDDRAAEAIARALRDAGMEVVYAGRQTPEQVVRTVVQEDAHAVGLSGADPTLLGRTGELLKECGATDVVLFRSQDAPTDEVVAWVRANVTPGCR